MKQAIKRYFIRVGDGVSQLVNVAVLFGKNANESISGRSWKEQEKKPWGAVRWTIDFLASPFEKNHTEKSFTNDLMRAKELLEANGWTVKKEQQQ